MIIERFSKEIKPDELKETLPTWLKEYEVKNIMTIIEIFSEDPSVEKITIGGLESEDESIGVYMEKQFPGETCKLEQKIMGFSRC